MTINDSATPRSKDDLAEPKGWDDEIDLRQYLDVLIHWRREIVLMTVLSALASGLFLLGFRQLTTPQFRSSSDVVMARVVSIATLDERFQTLSSENPTSPASSTARRSALIGLAKSGAVAEAVINELGDLLNDSEQAPASLLETIEVAALPSSDNRTQSDLIRISTTADDPDKAAAIANAWARHYVAQINEIFGQVPAEIIESVETELIRADETYQSAQRTLEEFISVERTNELTRLIAEKQAQLDAQQGGREAALTAIIDRDLGARLNLYVNLVDAQNDSAEAVLTEQIERRLVELSQLHTARSRASLLKTQAQTLLTQIDAGGDAAAETNVLALQLLKAQVFAATAKTLPISPEPEQTPVVKQPRQTEFSLPADLQLAFQTGDASGQDAQAQADDVGALVAALEAYTGQLDEQIAGLSDMMLTGVGLDNLESLSDPQRTALDTTGEAEDAALQAAIERSYQQLLDVGTLTEASSLLGPTGDADTLTTVVQQLDRDIQLLQAQLEAETARSLQLTQQRDLAWNTYDALSNTVAELTLERIAANSEVRLGSSAIPPTDPLPELSQSIAVLVGAMLGFFLGVFVAFLGTYLGQQPFLSRRKPSPA